MRRGRGNIRAQKRRWKARHQNVYYQQHTPENEGGGLNNMTSNWKGIWITGTKDAVFIKKFYQPELDKLDKEIVFDGRKTEQTFEELSR